MDDRRENLDWKTSLEECLDLAYKIKDQSTRQIFIWDIHIMKKIFDEIEQRKIDGSLVSTIKKLNKELKLRYTLFRKKIFFKILRGD